MLVLLVELRPAVTILLWENTGMGYLQRTEEAAGGGYECVAAGRGGCYTPSLLRDICFYPKALRSYLLKCGASSKRRAVAHGDGAGDLLIENLGLKLAPTTCLPRTSLSIRFLAK